MCLCLMLKYMTYRNMYQSGLVWVQFQWTNTNANHIMFTFTSWYLSYPVSVSSTCKYTISTDHGPSTSTGESHSAINMITRYSETQRRDVWWNIGAEHIWKDSSMLWFLQKHICLVIWQSSTDFVTCLFLGWSFVQLHIFYMCLLMASQFCNDYWQFWELIIISVQK